MTRPSSFRRRVQTGKVRFPMQPGFSRGKWTASFTEHHEGDDESLHTAGLWFDARLGEIRAAMNAAWPLGIASPRLMRRAIGAANYETEVALPHVGRTDDEEHHDLINAAADRTVPVGQGRSITKAGYEQSVVDALRFELGRFQREPTATRAMTPREECDFTTGGLRLAATYHVLDYLCLRCVWSRYRVQHYRGVDVVRPPSLRDSCLESQSEYRRDLVLCDAAVAALRTYRSDAGVRAA
jgi:hypothetical protein